MTDTAHHHDVVIAGAGPTGLAFARSLKDAGLSIRIVDPQSEEALSQPAFDGREIALTHRSMAILKDLGVRDRLDAADISDLRQAQVTNGASPEALRFAPPQGERLGVLIPNHRIREALFHLTAGQAGVAVQTGRRIVHARPQPGTSRHPGRVDLRLDDGTALTARLLVAADSRFSSVRTQLGVGADIHPLGRSMIVCRVRHSRDHGHVAAECFDHGQTLAFLPLNADADGFRSSIVLTLPSAAAEDLVQASNAVFEAELNRRAQGRLGPVSVISPRHLYPLTVSWSRRFAGGGFALIGDAAVGMNPVTAHGFNLGLKGQERLARQVLKAHARGRWIGCAETLSAYEAGHRRDTLPLYAGTNAIARLFGDERAPARVLRSVVLGAGRNLPPFRHAVSAMLTDGGGRAPAF
ncbi:5-demethoxyubiquinol-8 5-hydroxylase UbiM [Brevundimonas diminuta]|uniref:5-demethoxyubiquinol-8 5-hydroxylase UbiM n=1 Tax=Brevundimonas diminuta TaxID=293 RepID=UPI003D074FE3